MSGIINQVGARSGIISGGGAASTGTVTQSGTTQLDYEEGTWTPAMTTQRTESPAAVVAGTYTKIGDTVFIKGRIASIGNTGGGSAVSITGLPFTNGAYVHAFSVSSLHAVNWPTGALQFLLQFGASGTTISTGWAQDSSYLLGTTGTDFASASCQCVFSGTYKV